MDQSCLDTRTVTVRDGAPISGLSVAEMKLQDEYGIKMQEIRRDGVSINNVQSDFIMKPGDELVLSGSASAFAKAAPLFRTEETEEIKTATPFPPAGYDRHGIDLEQVIELERNPNPANCLHLDRILRVTPSAKGCEECLREGDDWVHLRICMTCGHVGCCDDPRNKHAAKHYEETDHPFFRAGRGLGLVLP